MANRYWVGGTASWNGTAGTKWTTLSGGTGGAAEPTAADDVFFDGIATGGGPAGAITVTVATSARPCLNLNLTGYAGTLAGTVGINVSASFIGANITNNWTGVLQFIATTAQTITSNGMVFGGAVTFNGVGGVYRLLDAFVCTGVVTSTRGAFDCNSQSVKAGSFVSSSGFTRTWALGNSLFEVTSTGGVVIGTLTGQTVTTGGSSKIKFSGVTGATPFTTATATFDDVEFSAGNSTLTISQGTFRDVLLTNVGSGTLQIGGNIFPRSIDFTGFNGTWAAGGGVQPRGDFILSPTMTCNFVGAVTMIATSGAHIVNSNGFSFPGGVTFANSGATYQIVGNLALGGPLLHSSGTSSVDASGIVISCQKFQGGPGLTDFTGSTITCTTDTNAWICGAGTVCTMAGSEVILSNVSGNTKNFSSAGVSIYHKVSFTGGGAGQFTMTGAHTIDTLKFVPGVSVSPGGETITNLIAIGTALLPIHINGPIAGISCPANDIVCDWLVVASCTAKGGARWFAGRNSVNAGGNNGWRFTDRYRSPVTVEL